MGKSSQIITPLPTGFLFGLGLSNNGSDATNDIDFATGSARDSLDLQNLVLTGALTKQLDAAWAAGTNVGGRMSAAAIANTTYFCFIIGKPDGTIDVGFDTSPTAPTLPTGYTVFRRIGAIIRASAAILPFLQDGDSFSLKTPVADSNIDNQGTSPTLITLASLPVGLRVRARLGGLLTTITTSVTRSIQVSDPSLTADSAQMVVQSLATAGNYRAKLVFEVFTNIAAQVKTTWAASEAGTTLVLVTYGWTDTRGRV